MGVVTDEPLPITDPRDEPAPFGTVVLLTAVSAVAITVIAHVLPDPPGMKLMLLGPVALVAFEVVVHEVWWKRWWGAVPAALAALVAYFEGRDMMSDVLPETWAEPVAYVAAWTLFAALFALASRLPRTDFTTRGSSPGLPPR